MRLDKEKKEEIYAVIDLKSFYASCECADRGLDLFTTPLVVADKERTDNSIVMSVTPYLKANYGVPNVCRIKDLPALPDMVFATPRMAYYIETSAKVVSILLDYVAEEDLHVYSIDESFIRITPYLKAAKCNAEEYCRKILMDIKNQLGLVATAGIGPNMFLAKTCLDIEAKKKEPYIAYWHYEDVKRKLWKVSPITKIWGISTGISSHLSRLGIRSIEALAKADIHTLRKEFGVMGLQLHNLANGIDYADIREKYVPKETNLSIGQTLIRDYSLKETKTILREMTDDLCFRLRLASKKSGCVSLFMAYSSAYGGGFSRQCSLDIASDDPNFLFEAVMSLFDRFASDCPVRQLGISFSKLSDYGGQQYSLFEDMTECQERRLLHQQMDKIHALFGPNAALRATSLLPESTIIERHGQIGGHKA